MSVLTAWVGIALMVIALVVIPLGFPGLWIMIGVIAVGAILGEVGLLVLITTTLLAGVAEIIEFFVVKRLTARYGGSKRAFWGALLGGFVGVVVGLPVPVIGSLIAGLLGSFAGAALVTYTETKELAAAQRVGAGVVIGRMISAVVKTGAGIGILVLGAAALLT